MNKALLFPDRWWINNLLDEGFVEQKTQELLLQLSPQVQALDLWLQAHLHDGLAGLNESQLEHDFIWPLLEQLGWHAVPQQSYTVQGKQAKPDWSLVLSDQHKDTLLKQPDAAGKAVCVAAIAEAKAWSVELDNGKANSGNPHHQLQDYLSTLRVRFGFLTNGRIWRLYDTQEITARKTYLQIDLPAVMSLATGAERERALTRLVFFFARASYEQPAIAGASVPDVGSPIALAFAQAESHALAVEENLKAVIYGYEGEDSLFEQIGLAIYKANSPSPPSLDVLYRDTLTFLFRLLFIVYFEDRNKELLAAHSAYEQISLKTLYWGLRKTQDRRSPATWGAHNPDSTYTGIYALKQLFSILEQGSQDIDIPLFNGGLFEPERAPLLQAAKIFDNASLKVLLDKLLFKTHRGQTLFDAPRDFNTMSVTHLGRIYEGLLEFRFEVAHENAVYLEYQSAASKGKSVEAYFDDYDAAVLRKQKSFKALREVHVRKGEVFLKSASNSRKASASYYTPSSLSQRLVKAGIDQALAAGRPITDVRVLDNACGSGHFLVEALGYLTDLALLRLQVGAPAYEPALQDLVRQERQKIEAQLASLNIDCAPSDAQIVKRLLLKRCIYGVDLNPFAVELARLSLWMDSFVFGTPLSFIEHHVRHGNALLGAGAADFVAYHREQHGQGDLFVQGLHSRFDELREIMSDLGQLCDSTPSEVASSKTKWHDDIVPRLALLGRALDFISTRQMLHAAGNPAAVQALDTTPNLFDLLFDAPPKLDANSPALLRLVAEHASRWHFFHYEVAFPEVFGGPQVQRGFDVIVGNPPWDKTKFSDTDFFPQYHSSYRQLKDSEKAQVQQRLLSSPHIQAAYLDAQRSASDFNVACQNAYPLNRGVGDGNLFRLFVERSLGLLAEGASLCYCLPSALMFETGSLALRKHILTRYQLRFFHGFENRMGLFPDVHRSYKFALLQVCNSPPVAQAQIDSAFYVHDPVDLDHAARRIPYPLSALQTLSPQQWAMMELRHAADLPLLARCYSAFAPLQADWLDFRRELDMTNDKALFQERHRAGLLPLFEGKMIWQYSHCLAEPTRWIEPQAFDAQQRSKELHRLAQDLGIKKPEAGQFASAIRFDREFVRLGFRDIASDTNERTLVFALLPAGVGVGNTLNISVPKRYVRRGEQVGVQAQSPLRLLFALAWFNSLPADWIARFMIQIHANKTYLYRLPMPQPSDDEILANPAWFQLARKALLLTLAAGWEPFASDLAEVRRALGVVQTDAPITAKSQDALRAEIDCLVAQAYGYGGADFAHLLRSFPGMQHKRPEYAVALERAWDV